MQKSENFDECAAAATASGSNPEEQLSSSKSSDSGSGGEFQINLNEFLDFLKFSCHVNDMITKVNMSKSNTREPIPPAEGGTGIIKRNSKMDSEFDFDELAENHLVNELLGLKRQHPYKNTGRDEDCRTSLVAENKQMRTTHVHGGRGRAATEQRYRGLHPKLSEQLEYVINEGVLDSVLSFICPVAVPTPATASGRAKPNNKQQKPENLNPIGTATIKAGGMEQTGTPVGSPTLSPTTSAQLLQAVPQLGSDAHVHGMGNSEPNNMVRAQVKDSSAKPALCNAATRRKSLMLLKDSRHARLERKEPEVIIHVCDEVKNTSRDFSCPQSLLVSKMGYFANVTAGQRLDEMDISVHCDIQIFDWLMKWIKHSAQSMELPPPGQHAGATGPQLDGNNVVPILVSASFLQMEPLLLECLAYCHAHLSEVVRTSTNLSCLNDAIVTRLAAMFTNLELEMVRDKKERVTPRLWTKLIQSLCEPEPEVLRGHFYSMAGLFRCLRCFGCMTNTMKSYMNCVPTNIRLNRWGELISQHVRDSNWQLSHYIAQLFKELKSWRKVYWKLWGHCHYLYCCACESHFPVYQMNWCRFHPEPPSFLGPATEGRIAGPAGRYGCCGQQAFRYETLPGPNGCQFREHSVLVETDRERAILAIAQLVAENYALCELPPLRLQEMAAAAEINPSWMGILLTPQRCRQGLLPQLCMDMTNHRVSRRMRAAQGYSSDSDTSSSSADEARKPLPNAAYTSSSDGCESEQRLRPPRKTRAKKTRKRRAEVSGRFWSGELSARSNQDHQRDFEEKIMKQVVSYVSRKTGSDQALAQNAPPLGGSYVRLEAEWKDMFRQRHNTHSLSSAGSNGNTQAPYTGVGAAGGGMVGGVALLTKQKHK